MIKMYFFNFNLINNLIKKIKFNNIFFRFNYYLINIIQMLNLIILIILN